MSVFEAIMEDSAETMNSIDAKNYSDFVHLVLEFEYKDIEIMMGRAKNSETDYKYGNIYRARRRNKGDIILRENYGILRHSDPGDEHRNTLRLVFTAERGAEFIRKRFEEYSVDGFSVILKSNFPNPLFARTKEQLFDLAKAGNIKPFMAL